jgi:5-hydroxyisourate hydrolase-like protein (transthyretin family)
MAKVILVVALTLALCVFGDDPTKYTDSITTRSTKAEGKLVCGDQPAKNVHVRLYKRNTDDLNDVLGSAITGDDGRFKVEGNTGTHQGTDAQIDPHLKFYHFCDEAESKKGFRRVVLRYPRDFVTLGRVPRNSYNIGTLNLQLQYPNEGREKDLKGVRA